MKAIILALVSILVFSTSSDGQMKYWEDLNSSQKSEMLGNCKSVAIKRFYEGKLTPTDDEKTDELLKIIVASSDSILPLSFYLMNKIVAYSDGALAEMVAGYSVDYLATFPQFAMTYFSKERISKVKKPIFKTYAMFAGSELYFKIKGTSDLKYNYKNFKEILLSASKGNKDNEETFKVFWKLVDETIKSMD
jgi:hypothetical protein